MRKEMAWLLWLALAKALEVVLLFSSSTPQSLPSLLLSSPLPLRSIFLSNSTSMVPPQAEVLLDYTFSAHLSSALHLLADAVVLCMYPACAAELLTALCGGELQAATLAAFVTSLGFKDAFLVSDLEPDHKLLSESLQRNLPSIFSATYTISPHLTLETTRAFVGKVLKPSGRNQAIFLVSSETAASLLLALYAYRLYEAGFVYIFAQSPIWNLPDWTQAEGVLFLSDSETAAARTWEEYQLQLLQSQLEVLGRAEAQGIGSHQELRNFVKVQFQNCSRNCSLSLANVAAGQVQTFQVGDKAGLIYPGNSTLAPVATKPTILVSVNSDGSDSDGSAVSQVAMFSRGTYIAYEDANRDSSILPNFHLNVSQVGFGFIHFNYTWAYERVLLALPQIGVAYHGVPFTQNVLGVKKVFERLAVEVPNVTPAGSSELSDPGAFPLFLRVACSNKLFAIQIASLFQLFDWHYAAFIYSDSDDDRNAYESFVNVSAQFHITLTNSEHNRCLPVDLTADLVQVNTTLLEIMTGPYRIIIISHIHGYKITERLYDLGVRSGEYLIIMEYGLSPGYYSGLDEVAVKRRTVAAGALMPMPTLFVGSKGRYVQRRLMEIDGDNYYASGCMYYDNAMLIAHTLGYMLAKGLHYEQGLQLAKEMRETRFVGCFGRVQIEKGTNDNIPGEFSYYNLQSSGDSETQLVSIATLSPYKTQRFTMVAPVQWPDGGEVFKDMWPMERNCPRYSREITSSPAGEWVGLGICALFIAYTAVFIAKSRWWSVRHSELADTQVMTLEDMVCLASPLIEAVQMAATAGGLDLPQFLERLLDLATFRFDSLLTDQRGVFWKSTNLALGLASVHLVALLLVSCNKQGRKCCLCSWAEFLLLSLGNWLFIPVLWVLLSVYMCSRGMGPGLSDAILDRDCAESCWTGSHTIYVVSSTAMLLVYIPAAVLARLWQLETELHVKEQPRHIMVKSLVEVGLVALCVSIKGNKSTLHSILNLCLVTLYTVLHTLIKAYNYNR